MTTTTLPPGNMFIPDWQEFFRKRNEADEAAEAVATLTEKQQWENCRKVAQGYHQPGCKGASVYTWTEAESGGYIRELVNRRDVWCVWDNYRRRDMLFNACDNTWDLCPMLGDSVDGPNQELDELDAAEDELAVSSLRTESIQKHGEQSSYKKTPQKNMLHNTHNIMLMTSSMKSL